ncbi:hypothetical protein PsalN5692_02903 [Piscirickettsia salmonis]|nr:hypothetical protein PsalN5692_02903 [Piscirickettsia salmonis]
MQLQLNLTDSHQEPLFMNREWVELSNDTSQIYLQVYALQSVQVHIIQMQQQGDSHSIVSTNDLLEERATSYELQCELGLPCGHMLIDLVFDLNDRVVSQRSLESFTKLVQPIQALKLLDTHRLNVIEKQVINFIKILKLRQPQDIHFELKAIWPEYIQFHLEDEKTLDLKTKHLYLVEIVADGSGIKVAVNQKYQCRYLFDQDNNSLKKLLNDLHACDVPVSFKQ